MRAGPKPIPAPVGGWNTRDSIESMPPEDAVKLDNLFPDLGYVSLRKGFAEHSTGLGGNVKTLAEYHAGSTRKLIACANGEIWDATSNGAASSLASGFGNDSWQWANMNGKLGLVNGTDAPQVYDGATVSAMTVSGSGLSTSNLIGINVHKYRSYFWEQNSQDFWYSATLALGGALTKFPLSSVSQFGGNLVAMGTWTIDGGSGTDDLAVFVMSTGDAVVYQGSDPSTANDWSLVGIYRIGAPLGIRSVVKFGGDLRLITRDDYISLGETLRSQDRAKTPKSKAVGALQQAVASYASNTGWQAILYPQGKMIIYNIPKSGSSFEQHVQNIITGSWCRFTGWNAFCFGVFNDDLYFGGSGTVYKAYTGYSDNNSARIGDAITSWNHLGIPNNKQVTAVQTIGNATVASVSLGVSVGADFKTPTVSVYETVGTTEVTVWGSPWGSPWSSGFFSIGDWKSSSAFGRFISTRLKVSSGGAGFQWNSTTYLVEPGGLV